MNQFTCVLQDIIWYIILAIITILIEFDVKYSKRRKYLKIEDFYTRGIRIVILITIAIKLNQYGEIYTFISFVLTYIICYILDNRYRAKFERTWTKGTDEVNKYLKKHSYIKMPKYLSIRIKVLKDEYRETFEIFRFKMIFSIILILVMYKYIKQFLFM